MIRFNESLLVFAVKSQGDYCKKIFDGKMSRKNTKNLPETIEYAVTTYKPLLQFSGSFKDWNSGTRFSVHDALCYRL